MSPALASCADSDQPAGERSSLLHLLLPAVLLPALALAFVLGVGHLAHSTSLFDDAISEQGAPGAGGSSRGDSGRGMEAHGEQGLLPQRTPRPRAAPALLAAGGRSARAAGRRLRSLRPVFVGPEAQGQSVAQLYRRGAIQAAAHLVAPMFRAPTASAAPSLPPIPEWVHGAVEGASPRCVAEVQQECKDGAWAIHMLHTGAGAPAARQGGRPSPLAQPLGIHEGRVARLHIHKQRRRRSHHHLSGTPGQLERLLFEDDGEEEEERADEVAVPMHLLHV